MDVLLLVVLCGGLCYASSESSLEPLTDHVVVLKVPHKVRTEDHVPLVCRNDNQTQAVFWKKDGVELKPPLQGNQVTVVVEEVDGGNYSCHSSDGQYLNHTVIFVHVETEKVILREISPEEGYIQCSVPNYSGPFRCSWSGTASRSNAAVLLLNATRWNGQEIPCELDADGSGIQCEEDNCPYKEEQHRIFLTTHIRRYYRLETYTKAFYIKDIVRPGALPNLQRSGANVFSWSYPDSWEKPCSFYGLNFQVKVVRHAQSCDSEAPILGNNTDDTKFEVNVKTKKYVFCVRAQDRYTKGPFGPWSNCVVNKDDVSC